MFKRIIDIALVAAAFILMLPPHRATAAETVGKQQPFTLVLDAGHGGQKFRGGEVNKGQSQSGENRQHIEGFVTGSFLGKFP